MRLVAQIAVLLAIGGNSAIATQQTDYQFAFGVGVPHARAQQVSAQDLYTAETGFGIEPNVNVPTPGVTNLPPAAPSVQDADGRIIAEKPFIFSAAVPPGNYRVTVTFGDPTADCITTVKAEARRLMLENLKIPKGDTVVKSFLVNVRSPEVSPGIMVKLDPREPGSFTWDDKLSLEFLGSHIAIQKIEIHKVDDAVTLYLCGDSTVTDQPIEPYGSWGQMLPRWFKDMGTKGVSVANYAESGETLKAFKLEKRWDKVMSLVKQGDYVLMQFGNNDMQTSGHNAMWPADDHEEDWANVHSDADTDYQTILKDWSAQVKAKRATPVIVAPYTKQRGGVPILQGSAPILKPLKKPPMIPGRRFLTSRRSAATCSALGPTRRRAGLCRRPAYALLRRIHELALGCVWNSTTQARSGELPGRRRYVRPQKTNTAGCRICRPA